MQHAPFQSLYRDNFQVVEERRGKIRLYPHTEQLSVLLNALNSEFYSRLPPRIARVDHRADGFHKITLKHSAIMFCGFINGTRADELRLYALPDPDLVYRLTVVQQLSENARQGVSHRFRFYGGEDFFPEIHLSGKRLVFTDHVLQRFGADLSGLRLLRDRLCERFMAGYLLNLGELAYRKEERIMIMPLSGQKSARSVHFKMPR